jgi:phosphohistidine phosphatase
MRVYLLRHAIAEDAHGRPDSSRALTAEGREKLRRVLKQARSAEIEPTLILSSPYLRALETAEIAAEVLGYKGSIGRTPTLLPEANPEDTWNEIKSRRSEDSILLASHEPLMSSLAAHLLGCPAFQVDMKKSGLICIDFDHPGAQPHGVLKWMLVPGVCGG